jgi:hypothetical protein
VAKKTSLSAALHEASGKKPVISVTSETLPPAVAPTTTEASALPPSRKGKKVIAGYFDPAVSKQLRQLALEHDTTVQALLAEALDLLFVERGKMPIAGSDRE